MIRKMDYKPPQWVNGRQYFKASENEIFLWQVQGLVVLTAILDEAYVDIAVPSKDIPNSSCKA